MIIMIIFNLSTSHFYKKLFHYFKDYLMTKLINNSVEMFIKVVC
jgi:hypothetical protein